MPSQVVVDLLGALPSSDTVHGLTTLTANARFSSAASWVPSQVVEVVTQFAQCLNQQ